MPRSPTTKQPRYRRRGVVECVKRMRLSGNQMPQLISGPDGDQFAEPHQL